MTRNSLVRMAGAAVLVLSLAGTAWAGDLTPRDLVELHRAGLGEDVLVALVEADGGPFYLSPAELVELKAEGLTDRLLAAMVRTARRPFDDGAGYTHVVSDCPPQALVPVGVPVPVPVRRWHRGHDATFVDHTPSSLEPSLGHVPVPRHRPRPSPSVDDIRHAGPGFHPGSVGPRTDGVASSTRTSRAPATSRAASRQRDAQPAAPTPGVARSSQVSTPGVARGPATSRQAPSTPGVARSSTGRSGGS